MDGINIHPMPEMDAGTLAKAIEKNKEKYNLKPEVTTEVKVEETVKETITPQPPATEKKTEVKVEEKKEEKKTETTTVDEAAIIKKYLKDNFGDSITSMDDIKSLLAKKEPTDAEKKKLGQLRESQVMEEFLSEEGNTLDIYNSIITKKGKENTDLVYDDFKNRFKDEIKGLSDEDKEEKFKSLYGIGSEDETDQKISQKRINDRATYLRNKLSEPIAKAEQRLETKTLQRNLVNQWQEESGKFLTDPNLKKIALDFGDEYGKHEIDVLEDVFSEVAETIKDPQKFTKLFLDEKGNTDKAKLYNILIKAKMFDKSGFSLYTTGISDGIKKDSAIRPSSPDFQNLGTQSQSGDDEVTQKKKAAKKALESKEASTT